MESDLSDIPSRYWRGGGRGQSGGRGQWGGGEEISLASEQDDGNSKHNDGVRQHNHQCNEHIGNKF